MISTCIMPGIDNAWRLNLLKFGCRRLPFTANLITDSVSSLTRATTGKVKLRGHKQSKKNQRYSSSGSTIANQVETMYLRQNISNTVYACSKYIYSWTVARDAILQRFVKFYIAFFPFTRRQNLYFMVELRASPPVAL